MSGQRTDKVANLFKRELSLIFQRETRTLCMGSMVSVTVVRVSPDLGSARVYVSIFAAEDKEAVLKNIKANGKMIRHELSQIIKNQMRKTPELHFYLDDSLDYAEEIEDLLNK